MSHFEFSSYNGQANSHPNLSIHQSQPRFAFYDEDSQWSNESIKSPSNLPSEIYLSSMQSPSVSQKPTHQCLLFTGEIWPRRQHAKRFREEVVDFSDNMQCEQDHKRTKRLSVTSMIVTIKTMSGSIVEIDIRPESSVLHLKHEIEAYIGIPVHDQRLIYSGQSLVDTQKLANYDIRNGSVIIVILSLHGG